MNSDRPNVLLGDATYDGTLAAVRNLGGMGARVTVLKGAKRTSISGASSYCSHLQPAPAYSSDGFLPWLLAWGEANPGSFLYPTSDDMAWLMAMNHHSISQRFVLFQPKPEAIFGLLDKSQLYAHAQRLGIALPTTHVPTSFDEVRELGLALEGCQGFPVIVKPRTQACNPANCKGLVVHDSQMLFDAVQRMVLPAEHRAEQMGEVAPNLYWPLVQAFVPEAQSNTYSMSGFIDQSGAVRAARASVKVFQMPVRVGVGVAFEGRPVLPELVQRVEALARATGYFGVFEVEFIHVAASNEHLLMDFNPRFYGQMQFEILRGMHLPRMAFSAAMNDEGQLSALYQQSDKSQRTHDAASERYCNRWLLGVLLRTQRLGGRLSRADQDRWHAWMNGVDVFDCMYDRSDMGPVHAERQGRLRNWIRHPRSSFRELFQ